MISQNRMQDSGSHSQSPIGCNLCGTNGASVRCDKCQSMAFCLSCDDMYHRHPKRRYHLRKAVALEMFHNNLGAVNIRSSNCSTIRPPMLSGNSGHPSKMPIPPPRRKRKGLTLSSIKDTFSNTGNIFRRFVSQEKSVNHLSKEDSKQLICPIIAKPMQTITPELHQNQTRIVTNTFRPLPPTPNYREDIPPPTPPKQLPQIYENFRKTSLPMNSFGRMSFTGKTFSSVDDISKEPEPERNHRFMSPALPPKMKLNSLQRNNCSLHDLSVDQTTNVISPPSYPPVCPHFMQNSQYYLNPWSTSSLTNSIEDLQLNDDLDDYESDNNIDQTRALANRKSKNRLKKQNMKRCQSAFQMFPISPMPSPIPRGQPVMYYYYPPVYGPPPPSSPPSPPTSIRSKSHNNNRRPSFDNGSTASSSRDQRSSSKYYRKNKSKVPDYVCSGKELSDSGGRSITSSSRQQSDFDDEEDFFSVSNDGSSQDEDLKLKDQWACRFCTFVNDMDKNICEICSKTRRKSKNTSENNKMNYEKTGHHLKRKTSIETKPNKNNISNNDIVFDKKLINEQKEIERELIRRLENERNCQKENEKIQRKEEFIRRKSLGLRIDKDMAEQIEKDENEINESFDKELNFDKFSENKSVIKFDSKSKLTKEVEKGIRAEPEEIVDSNPDRHTVDEMFNNNIQSIHSSDKPLSFSTPQNNSTTTSAQNSSILTNVSTNGQFIQNIDNQNTVFDINPNMNANSFNNQSNGQVLGTRSFNQFPNNNQTLGSQQFANFPIIGKQNHNSYEGSTYGSTNASNFDSSHGSKYIYQQQYQAFPQLNQQNQMVSNNIMPSVQHMQHMPQMVPINQMPSYYSQPFSPINSSQTRLDQLTNNVNYDQNFINPLSQQNMRFISNSIYDNRFASCEDLQSFNNVNDKVQQKSQLESGLHLIQLLRDAEKNGFTADDVEVAINFCPNKPLEWLDENWNNMVETVMTLTNNQIMQNEKKKGTKKAFNLSLITEKEAKVSLRLSKGNIWQAIEKCVKRKEENKLFGDTKSTFSLKISGLGSGKDNEDANFMDANDIFVNSDDNEDNENQSHPYNLIKSQFKSKSASDLMNICENNSNENIGSRKSSFQRMTSRENFQTKEFFEQENDIKYDRKMIDQLLKHWKNEKEITDRERNKLRKQEKEKQKLRKILELQRKISEFDSEDSDEEEEDLELEITETLNNQLEDNAKVWTHFVDREEINYNELISEEKSNYFDDFHHEKYDEKEGIEYIDEYIKDSPEKQLNSNLNYSDHEEYYSNDQSDSNEEFEKIDNRIQQKINGLTEKFNSNKHDKHLVSNDGEKRQNSLENEDFDLKSIECPQRLEVKEKSQKIVVCHQNDDQNKLSVNNVQKDDSDEDHEEYKMIRESETSVYSKINSKKDYNRIDSNSYELKIEAQKILREIDETLKQNLEDLELMGAENEKEGIQSNEENDGILVDRTGTTVRTSHPSLQEPVYGKQKGSSKLKTSLLYENDLINTNTNQNNDNNMNSLEGFAKYNDELPLKTAKVSEIDIDWNVVNEDLDNCTNFELKNAIIKKFDSIDNQDFDINEEDFNHEIKIKETESESDARKDELKGSDFRRVYDPNETKLSETNSDGNTNTDKVRLMLGLNDKDQSSTNIQKEINEFDEKINVQEKSSETKNNKSKKDISQNKLKSMNENKNSMSSESNKLSDHKKIKPESKSEEKCKKAESLRNSLVLIDKISDLEYSENFGWARTQYECEICATNHSINDIVVMISCIHFACKDCLQKYLTVQIRERQRLVIACPFCDEPNIDPDDDESIFEYLGLLDQLIKYLVPIDVHELFQHKVRDRALMRDPNFRWCTQCSSGFIAPNPQAKTVMCPDCKSLTCAKCRKTWKKQHFNISCEQFAEWEKSMDPEYAEQQLDKHLKEFGIDCPNCKFKYQLAKGGCMHFRCIQCSYDFCGGCQRPFKMGNRCGVSPFCEKLGLHSHHPRNCLFYLRDKETKELQILLDNHNIEYKTKLDCEQKATRCPVMEQKDTDSGMKDESCGRYIENAGLCRLHYKEYLGDLIRTNNIDPIVIFNEDELELVLKRENIRIPPKLNKETYKQKLVDMIQQLLPLNTNDA